MKIPTTGNAAETWTEPIPVREMLLPPKLRELRQKLKAKAKQEPGYRFYSLYGLICRTDVLRAGWTQVRTNRGAPGIDGVSVEQIDRSEESVSAFLAELEQALRTRSYRPAPVRRVYIPKPNGKLRPLGIPILRDRVVQTAVLLILEPIFEADFLECSHGFRPGRSAHDALRSIAQDLKAGRTQVYDADLTSYFDTIPHDKLMACVKMRVTDGGILRLLREWLKAPVVEPSDKGGPPTVQRRKEGTPQGGVISPLLANLYLHWFDKVFHRRDGPRHFANARLVRYADDLVVLARYMGPRIVDFVENKLEDWLGLKINREKTRIITIEPGKPAATLDFLGYSYRWERDLQGRAHHWLRMYPSEKTMQRQRQWVRDNINHRHCFEQMPVMTERLNRHYGGWKRYFSLGQPRREYRRINWHLQTRLIRHLRRRSQRGYKKPENLSWIEHLEKLGLVTL